MAVGGGDVVVVAGGHLPQSVHAAVAMLNDSLDAAENTLLWNQTPPLAALDAPTLVPSTLPSSSPSITLLYKKPLRAFEDP